MKDIKNKLLLYCTLTEGEKRTVETYVEAHPELAPLLEEARAFERLLQEARMLATPIPGDEALAYYMVTRYLSHHQPLPEAFRVPFSRIEATVQQDGKFRARYEVFARRLQELEKGMDAMAQFERLTGMPLAAQAEPDAREVSAARFGPAHAPVRAPRPRHALRLYRRTARWAVAATVVLVGLYSGLYLVSDLTRSDLEQAAYIEVDGLATYAARTRAARAGRALAPVDSLYLSALQQLRTAQTTTLGLFPRYRPEALHEAIRRLDEVVDQAPLNSFVYLEARFYRGKARLAIGDTSAARTDFQAVVEGQGSKAPDAVLLLDLLRSAR